MSKYIPGGLSLVHRRLPQLSSSPHVHTPKTPYKMVTHTSHDDFLPPTAWQPGHFQRPLSHHLARVTKTILLSFYPSINYNRLALAPCNLFIHSRKSRDTLYTHCIHHYRRPSWALQTPIIYIIVEITLWVRRRKPIQWFFGFYVICSTVVVYYYINIIVYIILYLRFASILLRSTTFPTSRTYYYLTTPLPALIICMRRLDVISSSSLPIILITTPIARVVCVLNATLERYCCGHERSQ